MKNGTKWSMHGLWLPNYKHPAEAKTPNAGQFKTCALHGINIQRQQLFFCRIPIRDFRPKTKCVTVSADKRMRARKRYRCSMFVHTFWIDLLFNFEMHACLKLVSLYLYSNDLFKAQSTLLHDCYTLIHARIDAESVKITFYLTSNSILLCQEMNQFNLRPMRFSQKLIQFNSRFKQLLKILIRFNLWLKGKPSDSNQRSIESMAYWRRYTLM